MLGRCREPQDQEVERGAETRVAQQARDPLALPVAEARLQQPDLLHGQREPARQRDRVQLVQGDAVGGATLRLLGLHALRLQAHQRAAVRRPQQQREQEGRRDRFVVGHALVGAGQARQHHPAQRAAAVGGQRGGGFGEQHLQQSEALQPLEAGHAVPGQEQLEDLLEQARRRGLGQQRRQRRDRRGGLGFDLEVQLGGQAHGAQHAHGIFAVALLGIADQFQAARHRVLEAADIVADGEVIDGVVQRVGGEVAAHRVVFHRAVDVVADQPAVVHLAVAAAVVDVGAEGGHLDDLAPEHHMRQPEAATDQPAVAELLAHLFGRGVGGDVEVLGMAADQQVTHCAADQIGLETGIPQAVEHAQRVRADVLARDGVLVARDGSQSGDGRNSGSSMQEGHAADWVDCPEPGRRLY